MTDFLIGLLCGIVATLLASIPAVHALLAGKFADLKAHISSEIADKRNSPKE